MAAWAEEQYCGLDGLPTELSVKAGICLLNLGRLEEAKQAFDELLEEGVDGFPDLFIKVADAYTCAPPFFIHPLPASPPHHLPLLTSGGPLSVHLACRPAWVRVGVGVGVRLG